MEVTKMNTQYESLVNQDTGKALNNCHVIWSSESDIGGNLVLYSYDTPVCEISINSQFIGFYTNWNYSRTTIKQVKMFICNYTGRRSDITTDEIKEWITSGYSDRDNYYSESYAIIKESA
jgi:hypothetical protein